MNTQWIIFFSVFLALVALLFASIFWYIGTQDRKWRKHIRETEELQELSNQGKAQRLEADLSVWLGSLNLPQLREQKKRQEAAHQLSVVLIERLMLRRYPGLPPKNHPQL